MERASEAERSRPTDAATWIDLDGEQRHLLAQIIVQLARDPMALLLVGQQQASIQGFWRASSARLRAVTSRARAANQDRLAGRVVLDPAL